MLTLTAFAWMCCVEMVIHWQFQAKRIVLVMEYCEGGSLYHMLDQPQYQFGLPEDLFLLVLFHVGRLTKKLYGEGFDFQPLTPHPTTTFGLLPCSTVFDNVIYCSLISGLYCHLLLAFLEDSKVIKCLLNIVITFHLLRAPWWHISTYTAKVGCPGFISCLGRAVLSLCVASVCLAMI